jgi:predicted TIM-barrel fold metal-dependent hydrolase
MDVQWRERAPRVVALADTDIWVVDRDVRLAVVGIQDQAGLRFEEPGRISKKARMDELQHGEAGWNPSLYMRGLSEDGVSGALLYPSTAIQAYRCVEGPLLAALARTYNDWIIDFCAADPARLRAVAMITVDDPAAGVDEMYRMAGLGAAALMLPVFPRYPTTYDQPEYERIWAAAEEIGLPVVFHLGSNQRAKHGEPPLDLIVHSTKDIHIQRSIGTLVLSGLLGRHPRLRVGAIEFGASWAGPLMRRLDAVYARNHDKLDYTFPDGEQPSDHFRRNVFLSFQDDRACIPMRHMLGVENLHWGNDYPHAESTYPRSHEFLAAHFADIPVEEAAAIAGGNAIGAYGFKP